jgi:excisionase family DNA binding protein
VSHTLTRAEILERKRQADIDNGKRLASIIEAASYYGVHPRTIRRAIATGKIVGYRFDGKLIRVDLNEVDERLLQQIPTGGNH